MKVQNKQGRYKCHCNPEIGLGKEKTPLPLVKTPFLGFRKLVINVGVSCH